MKKKVITFSIFCLFLAQISTAQKTPTYNFELGVFAGTSIYHGDLVENPANQIAEINPALGVNLRFNYGEIIAARANLMYGSLSGNDQNAENLSRRKRNLSFRSPIFELSVMPEFNIYKFVLPKSGYTITPAIFAGGGIFWFNPQAFYEGEWVDLQPLGTEGQGIPGNPDKYSRFAVSIPYGLIVKFALSEYTTIAWEFGYRYTFTDYLDDVGGLYPDMDMLAQTNGLKAVALSDRTSEYTGLPSNRTAGSFRRSSQSNDYYVFSGFSICVKLNPKKVEKP